MASLITIWWRDIPMQVIAREGRRSEKRVLDKRFQIAVDKAAMKAGKKSYGDYIEEMRREERAVEDEPGAFEGEPAAAGDLAAVADAEAARIDATYTKELLRTLVASGGVASGGDASGGVGAGGVDAGRVDADRSARGAA